MDRIVLAIVALISDLPEIERAEIKQLIEETEDLCRICWGDLPCYCLE